MGRLLRLAAALAVCAAPAPAPRADGPAALAPSAREKCPVCGMFVARYPEWVAAVEFADGSRAVFDGAKDLFRFLAEPGKFLPGRSAADVKAVLVTDYYAVKAVDGRAAFFVLGSDVLGPMGRELVPFGAEADAREFLADHRGTRVLRFAEVSPAVLKELE
jgi:nitrous oxide reductase accessory protein NosL